MWCIHVRILLPRNLSICMANRQPRIFYESCFHRALHICIWPQTYLVELANFDRNYNAPRIKYRTLSKVMSTKWQHCFPSRNHITLHCNAVFCFRKCTCEKSVFSLCASNAYNLSNLWSIWRQYTGWPRRNGTGYFPQYVDAITDVSVWGNCSLDKWYQDQQFGFSSLLSRVRFVRQFRSPKFFLFSLN